MLILKCLNNSRQFTSGCKASFLEITFEGCGGLALSKKFTWRAHLGGLHGCCSRLHGCGRSSCIDPAGRRSSHDLPPKVVARLSGCVLLFMLGQYHIQDWNSWMSSLLHEAACSRPSVQRKEGDATYRWCSADPG